MPKDISTGGEKFLQQKVQEWLAITGSDTIDMPAVARWLIDEGHWQRRQKTPEQLCAAEVSKALAHEMRVDRQGRTVRANYAYLVEANGQRAWEWATGEQIHPDNFRKAMTHRRNGLVSRAVQHATDVDSYNDNNQWGAQLELYDYDFNADVEESQLPEDYPDEDPDA